MGPAGVWKRLKTIVVKDVTDEESNALSSPKRRRATSCVMRQDASACIRMVLVPSEWCTYHTKGSTCADLRLDCQSCVACAVLPTAALSLSRGRNRFVLNQSTSMTMDTNHSGAGPGHVRHAELAAI